MSARLSNAREYKGIFHYSLPCLRAFYDCFFLYNRKMLVDCDSDSIVCLNLFVKGVNFDLCIEMYGI